ncbi:MAG TPA: energy transducer TonB [Candidatus Acidoferrum sp.]|nr:energy transducer TonB [Candidatus Acidoferrum sp.]
MKSFGWGIVFLLAMPPAPAAFAQKASDPVLESAQMPKYPPVARTAHVTGDLEAEFTLDEGGNVASVRILSGPPLLARPTEENIRTWKFHLPTENNRPGRKFKTTFAYRLSDRYVSRSRVPPISVTFDSFDRVEITSDQWNIEPSY